MTSATDNRIAELRRLLDERGVEYEETTEYVTTAYFDDKVIRYYGYDGDFSVEVIFPRPYLNNTEWLTPEQAIAATLGKAKAKDDQEAIVRLFLREISPSRDWDYLGEHEHALIADLINAIAATLGVTKDVNE